MVRWNVFAEHAQPTPHPHCLTNLLAHPLQGGLKDAPGIAEREDSTEIELSIEFPRPVYGMLQQKPRLRVWAERTSTGRFDAGGDGSSSRVKPESSPIWYVTLRSSAPSDPTNSLRPKELATQK